jgi:hypothetical protein
MHLRLLLFLAVVLALCASSAASAPPPPRELSAERKAALVNSEYDIVRNWVKRRGFRQFDDDKIAHIIERDTLKEVETLNRLSAAKRVERLDLYDRLTRTLPSQD